MTRALAEVLAVGLSAGCAGAPGANASAHELHAIWATEYVGSDELSLRIEGLPERRISDPQARLIVAGIPDQRLRVSMIDSGTGDVVCTLMARGDAETGATIEPNQHFYGVQSAKTFTRSGQLRLRGTHAELGLEALVEIEQKDAMVNGALSYRFGGERLD